MSWWRSNTSQVRLSDGLQHCYKNTNIVSMLTFIGFLLLSSMSTAWASYEANICFKDILEQALPGLSIEAGGKSVSTGADGCASITGLDEDNYTLAITTAGYKQPLNGDFNVGSNHKTHDFGTKYAIKTIDGYRIEGVVVDSSNLSLAGVTVSANGNSVTTDADGKFSISFSEADTYTLTFEKAGYPTVTRDFTVNDDAPLKNTGNVKLSIGYVQVCFINMFGQTVGGLTVQAGGKTATMQSNDCYLIEGLSTNNYTLTMSDAGYKSVSKPFTINSSSTSKNFNNVYLIKTTDGYRIEGTVSDASGAALSGVTVSADGKQAITDSSGKFGIYFSEAKSYNLNFAKDNYLSTTQTCAVSDDSPLITNCNARIITGYEVIGTVLDINKQPVVGALVEVGGQTATTGVDGKYSVTGIQTYGVQTLKISQGSNSIERSVSIAQNNPITNAGTLYLVDKYVVYGTVLDVFNKPISGIHVEAGDGYAVTDAEGKYQILVSATGSHTVVVKQAGYKEVSASSNSVSDTSPSGGVRNLYAISLTDGYYIYGNVKLTDSSIDSSQISIAIGDLRATPDSDGNFRLVGLIAQGNYDVIVNVDSAGYRTMTKRIYVNDFSPYNAIGTFSFAPNISMNMTTTSTKIELGGTMEYTVNITNSGYGPADKVEMFSDPPLPDGVSFVSAEVLGEKLPNYNTPADGGVENNCNITSNTKVLNCKYLGTLGGGQTTQMKVVVRFGSKTTASGVIIADSDTSGGTGGGSTSGIGGTITVGQPFLLSFGAIGVACVDCDSDDVSQIQAPPPTPRPVSVEHFLTMTLTGGTSQLEVGDTLSYQVVVSNSETAPNAITSTKLQFTLPELVALDSVTTTQGQCNVVGTTVTCDLDTLVSNTQATVNLVLKATLVGLGKVSMALDSDQVATIEKSTSNFSIIPPPLDIEEDLNELVIGGDDEGNGGITVGFGTSDIALVIDNTGSMGEENDALIAAISEFIPTLSGRGVTTPVVTLIEFKDDVTHRITTQNMNTLLSYVRNLNPDHGGDCPEASLMALKEALPKLNIGGRIILVTDASSHTDVNVDDLITALRAKAIRVDVILSGDDCVGVCQVSDAEADSVGAIEVFSRIAEETGGLFATPFEVNAGTASGATKYQKVALNVMLSAVSPSITSVMPSAVPQGTTIDLALMAANAGFKNNSEVSFGAGIEVNAVKVLSSSKMVVNVTVSDTANVSFRDVTVTTEQGDTIETAKGLGLLEVVATSDQPQILGISPAMAARNGTATVTITGVNTDFSNSSRVNFGDGVTATKVIANSQTSLTVELAIAADASKGLHKATITTGGAVVTNDCSADMSPATGSLLITPALEESTVPRLIEITPSKGAQGAIRKLQLTAVNTHFEQDVTELSFAKQGIYVLELEVVSETELNALVQIDPEADIGYWDVFTYTNNEFASLLDGFEVTTKGPYTIEGCVFDKDDQPLANLELDTGNQLGFTDETGCYSISGLWEGEYVMSFVGDDNNIEPVDFIVSDNLSDGDNSGVVRLDIIAQNSAMAVDITHNNSPIVYQGDTFIHTITVKNNGKVIATGVSLTDLLPDGASFVAANVLEGGICTPNAVLEAVTCTLPDIDVNSSVTVTVKGKVEQATGHGIVSSTAVLYSNEYPTNDDKIWNTFRPYLSVYVDDNYDPIRIGQTLIYLINVELSQYATDAATGVKLVSYLPNGVEFKSVSTEYGTCDSSDFPKVTCDLNDLDVNSVDSTSHITVSISVIVRDPGLLLLTHEAQIISNEYPMFYNRERTKVLIPDGVVDLVFVIDETGSMQQEINAVIRAVTEFIAEQDGSATPWLALVVFKDEVVLKAATQDLDVFLKALNSLKAEGGGSCPEAVIEAINIAVPHVKQGGSIVVATDAAPYADADIEGTTQLLLDNGIHLHSILTGDCSEQTDWNP